MKEKIKKNNIRLPRNFFCLTTCVFGQENILSETADFTKKVFFICCFFYLFFFLFFTHTKKFLYKLMMNLLFTFASSSGTSFSSSFVS